MLNAYTWLIHTALNVCSLMIARLNPTAYMSGSNIGLENPQDAYVSGLSLCLDYFNHGKVS